LNEEASGKPAARHQGGIRPRHRPHAANGPEAFADLIVKSAGFPAVVSVQCRVDSEEQHVPRIEPDVDLPKIVQRAEEQSCADEQYERDGDLRDDQRSSEQAPRC
jgi:hypothetical protein